MNNARNTLALLGGLCFALSLHAQSARPEFDVLIRGGRVVDGTGSPWSYADVALTGDTIAQISRAGTMDVKRARRVIDASGMVVTPGFIDMHSHSDLTLLVDGKAQSKVRMGVTTDILGESGSVAPRCPAPTDEPPRSLPKLKRDWRTFEQYFARLMKQGTAINVGSYIGSGTVRECAMGEGDRKPTAAELTAMKGMVRTAMQQGAFGLSTGLEYPPASFATTEELIELARVVAEHGGMYTPHMRDEEGKVEQAIAETVRIAAEAKVPAHIFHLKTAEQPNWGRMKQAVAQIQAARDAGVEISADVYPYIAFSTGLSIRVPQWAHDGGTAAMLVRLRDPEQRKRIHDEISAAKWDWSQAVVSLVMEPHNKKWEGRTITEIARESNKSEVDTALDLLLEERGSVSGVFFGMHEDDLRLAMRQPWVSIGSDGSALATSGELARGKPHPRNYGSFARVLQKYVLQEKVLTLEEAIRKMTSLSASQMGIRDRGVLRAGMKADVLVFDPAKIVERTTFQDPHQYSEGMHYVIVNGQVVLDAGEHTGALPGQIVYGPGHKVLSRGRPVRTAR